MVLLVSVANLQLISLEKDRIQNTVLYSPHPSLAHARASCSSVESGADPVGRTKKTQILWEKGEEAGEKKNKKEGIWGSRIGRDKVVWCIICAAVTTSCVICSTHPTFD